VNGTWWDLLYNLFIVFCTEVWLLVSGGTFLFITDIISYQLATYWVIIVQPAKLKKYVKAVYQYNFILGFYLY